LEAAHGNNSKVIPLKNKEVNKVVCSELNSKIKAETCKVLFREIISLIPPTLEKVSSHGLSGRGGASSRREDNQMANSKTVRRTRIGSACPNTDQKVPLSSPFFFPPLPFLFFSLPLHSLLSLLKLETLFSELQAFRHFELQNSHQWPPGSSGLMPLTDICTTGSEVLELGMSPNTGILGSKDAYHGTSHLP
jgi:hypothetical protein